jgi:aryl-alcohol dehydrogenase-like predicted oxidoreductase
MTYRTFGSTNLAVSTIGFGAWGIGGPAMAGDIPIGWGDVDDAVSLRALQCSFERGITFYDTADFYGLGHSEELIGKAFSGKTDVIIATKVGHRLRDDRSIALDYSKKHILSACEQSLRRLRRNTIDYYQLHSAKRSHLEEGECIEAMEELQREGKIRYWGLSLNTFNPDPEADYMLQHQLGNGFQLVFNIINQKALLLIEKAASEGYGIIARMPLQFGLLTGKFTPETIFQKNDHRSFRFTPSVLKSALTELENIWPLTEKYGVSKTTLALSYCAAIPGITTIIPGIKTEAQATANTEKLVQFEKKDLEFLRQLYNEKFIDLVKSMAALK